MTPTLLLAALCLALLIAAYGFVNASPRAVADALRVVGPLLMCVFGFTLILIGRAAIGLPLLMMGGLMFARNRKTISGFGGTKGYRSTVRSAWLEMQLDHETGDLDGTILIGNHEGMRLSTLDGDSLLSLYADLSGDNESAALMEAYLDRRIPGWREGADTDTGTRSGEAFSSGPMTKEEAYQVLGLDPGASPKDIRTAHRRLMKAVHPDSGGSTFLAARINQAKDTLLD